MAEMERMLRATVTDCQFEQFIKYHRLLVEWNERMNLTAVTDTEGVFGKHFLDSLVVRTLPEWGVLVQPGARVADVGTGAGFPGIPLSICYPHVQFTLFDALQKRLTFLAEVISTLKLENVQLVHGRAEDLAHEYGYRNGFDAVVSRAVARLNVLLEWTTPFVKPGGVVFAYKGPGVEDELVEGKRAAKVLKTKILRIASLQLPAAIGARTMVVAQQKGMSPATYPRKAGTAAKSPLGKLLQGEATV